MIIKNKELNKLLKEHGKEYTLTMYANHYFDMTKKQLDYVLKYSKKIKKDIKRIKCDICGYYNGKDFVKYSGVCHLCGKILDNKAYFKQQMIKRLRLWRGKKFRNWN